MWKHTLNPSYRFNAISHYRSLCKKSTSRSSIANRLLFKYRASSTRTISSSNNNNNTINNDVNNDKHKINLKKNSKNNLPSKVNVIVAGGGIIGTSVAYHLAKLGVEDVLLLERDKLTSGTTWHAAGLINTFGSLSGTSTSMRMYTKELYSKILPKETGMETGFKPIGFIELACDAHRLEYYRRIASFNRFCGVNVIELTPQDVQTKFPLLDTTNVLAGFYVEDDGRVNPHDVTMALAKGARDRGVMIREGVSVEDVLVRTKNSTSFLPSVTGVLVKNHMDRGGDDRDLNDQDDDDYNRHCHEIRANVVVNCMGMWARQFGEKSGVNIPNQAAEHYYLVTDQMDEVDPNWPIVEDSSKCVYIRPEAGGLMLGLFERMGAPWNVDSIPQTFSFGEIEPDWDRMGPYLEDAMERVPMTMNVGAKTFFCGPESFTPDGCPIVGEAPNFHNYFVAAGLNSIGILTGGGLGNILARWIRDKKAPNDVDVTGINIDRFHTHQSNPMYRRDRVGEILGETYKVHYPDHQLQSCRNVKKSVLHDRLVQKNAHFKDVSGWESPSWYAPKGIMPVIEKEHFGRQNFFKYWETEHRACRENVALFDMSFMSKFLVQGRDAGKFLNNLSTANVDGETGKITYTQWLNEEGYMEADLTVNKMEDNKFLIVATDTMHNHVLAHMHKRISTDMHVFVTDVTGTYAQINIQGPNSRNFLQNLTSTDLNNEAFPFRMTKEIDIGYARALCARITYVGELGYELFVPVEQALHVYDQIMKISLDQGFVGSDLESIQHAGLRALGSLRMEKGYRDYGHDVDNTDTVLECGLGFTRDFKKRMD
eukprot:CAMPEP_0184860704 /NCGR_PEP_ID=MMETSP0580-20130426/5544_1 /TAXON_ID=1118495 /ORGANISM="Dactyliosolen fragilissimus" /LENGTH=822 /DNA_ID=CAMNT_0027357913 /DNA_START=85 /DNA_END=2553 /DNA_ORIENTATION=+